MNTTAEAYKMLISEVLESPLVDSVTSKNTVGSSFGEKKRPFYEKIGAQLTTKPGQNMLKSARRPMNEAYALASSAWILLGRDDLGSMRAFNVRGDAFSRDGEVLCAAFGARMRKQGPDQLDLAVNLLKGDPTTRRAMIVIGRNTDLEGDLLDFPCATSMHLLLRGGKLDAVINMRSQSLVGVFPYDLVNFAYIQQHAARGLGAEIGDMHWQFGSVHIYQDETMQAKEILADEALNFANLTKLPEEETTLSKLLESWTNPEEREKAMKPWLGET